MRLKIEVALSDGLREEGAEATIGETISRHIFDGRWLIFGRLVLCSCDLLGSPEISHSLAFADIS